MNMLRNNTDETNYALPYTNAIQSSGSSGYYTRTFMNENKQCLNLNACKLGNSSCILFENLIVFYVCSAKEFRQLLV